MTEKMGLPLVDGISFLPLEHGEDHIGMAKKLLSEVPVGITHFILHPSIAPDWQARVTNYNAFISDELKTLIENEDIKLIGYRQIQDAMRNG